MPLGQFTNPQFNQLGFNNLQDGDFLRQSSLDQYSSGLPPQLRARLETQGLGNISGQIQAGRSRVQNAEGSTGGKLGAIAGLYGGGANAAQNLQSNIAQQDYGARQQGLQNYQQLLGLGANIGGMKNQFNLQSADMRNQYGLASYQLEQQYKPKGFDWGGLLGGILGLGGSLGGAMLGRP